MRPGALGALVGAVLLFAACGGRADGDTDLARLPAEDATVDYGDLLGAVAVVDAAARARAFADGVVERERKAGVDVDVEVVGPEGEEVLVEVRGLDDEQLEGYDLRLLVRQGDGGWRIDRVLQETVCRRGLAADGASCA